MFAYCIFAETVRCSAIAGQCKRMYLDSIYPQIIQREWVKGTKRDVSHALFPGYVFVYTEQQLDYLPRMDGLIRWLGGKPLSGSDEAFAMMLLRKHGTVGTVSVIQVGSMIQIDDPAWEGFDGRIIKVDRQRERCCIEFEFNTQRKTIWVGFDLVRQTQAEPLDLPASSDSAGSPVPRGS